MIPLAPLIPRPILIETNSIAGKLRIDGNIEHNAIQFRFRFYRAVEKAPVCLNIYAAGKTRRYYCTISGKDPKEIRTPVFSPDFTIGQCFRISGIEPLAHFFLESPKIGFQIDN